MHLHFCTGAHTHAREKFSPASITKHSLHTPSVPSSHTHTGFLCIPRRATRSKNNKTVCQTYRSSTCLFSAIQQEFNCALPTRLRPTLRRAKQPWTHATAMHRLSHPSTAPASNSTHPLRRSLHSGSQYADRHLMRVTLGVAQTPHTSRQCEDRR